MQTMLSVAVTVAILAAAAPAQATVQKTFTYKTVGDLAIRADVYRADDDRIRPLVVWIHGGALINGSRRAVNRRLKNAFLAAGYIVLSCDYRLAPETKLPGIISDIEDLFRWIGSKGPKLFRADTRRIAVCGGSAGGYLTLVTGHRVKPKPRALVSLWGYGDLIGDWYSKPSPHKRHWRTTLTLEQAFAQVGGSPIADARDRKGDGSAFYQFCRQKGLWPKAVSGFDPRTDADEFRPFMPVRNVTPGYPPTLMIHGTKDTDVPFEQSAMMAAEFRKHGVGHRLVRVEGAEHGLWGAGREKVVGAYAEAIRFVRNRLDAPCTLSQWNRGIAITSPRDPRLRMHLWFYEWHMFGAYAAGQHTHGTSKNEIRIADDKASATVVSAHDGIRLRVVANAEGAELILTVTNKTDRDWPGLAAIIPCFNPGPRRARNAAFANTKTFFLGEKGLQPLALEARREIHFNKAHRAAVDAEADDDDRYAWSGKWPKSKVDATAGLIVRESTTGSLVTGIAWDRFLSAQGHNPWQCMHLSVHVGPLARGETRTVRGRVYLLEGRRGDVLARYRADFADPK